MIGIVAWHRLAVQVHGSEAVGLLRHKWYYWPPAIVLGFLAIMFSLLPQVVVFNLMAQVVGNQQTYLMLAALAGGIIFTAISLKFYYKLSSERLKFGWKDLGIALVSTIAMRIVIILVYSMMQAYQQQTANDVSLGNILGLATEPSLWIAS